jgi:hypothetical protein
MSITFKAADHAAKIIPTVSDAVAKLDAGHPAAAAQVASAISAAVDSYAAKNNISGRSSVVLKQAVAEALGAGAADAASALAKYAAQIGVAKTQLRDGPRIHEAMQRALASFRPADFEAGRPYAAHMAQAMSTLAPLASVIGTTLAHDSWYLRSIGSTMDGPEAANVGGSKVHARPHMKPLEAIIDREPDLGKNDLFRHVLGLNRRGLEGVFSALALNEVPTGASFEADAAKLPDLMAKASDWFQMPVAVKAELHRTGDELRRVYELAQAQPGQPIPWQQFPRAYQAVAGAQAYFVKEQLALPKEERRYEKYAEFSALPHDVQLQNLPIAVAGVHAMLEAANVADRLVREGTLPAAGAPGDVDYMLHAFLAMGAQQALGEKDFDKANDYHARVVALQALTSMTNGRDVGAVYPIFVKAAAEAGKQFDPKLDNKKAASDAPKIGFKYAAQALAALYPEVKMSEAQWQESVQRVLSRATVDDVSTIMSTSFGRKPIAQTGEALSKALIQLNADLKDEWFAEATKKLPYAKDGKSLDKVDLEVFEVLLRMANLTWMSGQVHRARGDGTRVDPFKRAGVYQPYHMLAHMGSELEALYVVAKDMHEMRKAAGLVEG